MTQLTNPLEVLKSLSEATSMLIRKISKSVVSVKAQMSRGTGVVISKDGYIVTCNHVLQGCSTVKIGQGEKTFNAKIVGADPYNDLAVLKAEKGEFTPIEIGDSDKLSVGQYVLALANPFNRSSTNRNQRHGNQRKQHNQRLARNDSDGKRNRHRRTTQPRL